MAWEKLNFMFSEQSSGEIIVRRKVNKNDEDFLLLYDLWFFLENFLVERALTCEHFNRIFCWIWLVHLPIKMKWKPVKCIQLQSRQWKIYMKETIRYDMRLTFLSSINGFWNAMLFMREIFWRHFSTLYWRIFAINFIANYVCEDVLSNLKFHQNNSDLWYGITGLVLGNFASNRNLISREHINQYLWLWCKNIAWLIEF